MPPARCAAFAMLLAVASAATAAADAFPAQDPSAPLVEGLVLRQTVRTGKSIYLDRARMEVLCKATGTPLAVSAGDAALDGQSEMTSFYHGNRVAHYNDGHALVAKGGLCQPELQHLRTATFVTRTPQGEDVVEFDFEKGSGRHRFHPGLGSFAPTPGLARVVKDVQQRVDEGPPGWTASGQAKVAGDHSCKLWVLDTPKLHSQSCRVLPPAFATPFADLVLTEWFDYPAGQPDAWFGGKFESLDWKARFRENVLQVPGGAKIIELPATPIPGGAGPNAGRLP